MRANLLSTAGDVVVVAARKEGKDKGENVRVGGRGRRGKTAILSLQSNLN